jgi:hypothetical protein
MAEQFSMPSMFDTRYAMDRQMELDAQKAGQVGGGGKRYGMYYNSSLLGDRDNASLMSLTGMMGGQGDPRIQKQNAIDTIMQQYPNPSTAQDFKSIANALQAQGLYDESARAMQMSNDITASMPTRAIQADVNGIKRYVDTGEQVFDGVTKTQTPVYSTVKVGTTDKDGNRITETYQFVDGKKGDLLGSQPTDAPGSEGKSTYKTFIRNDDLGRKVTDTYLVPPSGVLPQDADGNFTDKPVETFTEQRKTLLDNGIWKFVDDGKPVFSGTTATKDENDLADEAYEKFFTDNPQLLATPQGNKDFLLALIEQGLTGSNKFTQIIASIDQDSVNEIQRQIGIEKGIERLSVNYTKSDVGQMDGILTPIETQINEYMPHLTTASGDLLYDRNGNAMRDTSKGLPGWELLKRGQRYFGSAETVRAAKNFAEDAQLLLNTIIKQRSGSAVSIQEAQRLVKEYETGLPSSESFANWVSAVRKITEERRMGIVAGYSPEVQYGYFSQMGILPTLYDPENQEKLLPIGARWKDEAGNIYEKTQ